MLTITPSASEAIRGVLEGVPEGSLLRISSQPDAGLVISLTDQPQPDDHVVQGEDVEVCLEPQTSEMLADKELDATVIGDQVNFTIGPQGGGPEA